MNKSAYSHPLLEVISFENLDVITGSNDTPDMPIGGGDDTPDMPIGG